jgi:hypothetical protein
MTDWREEREKSQKDLERRLDRLESILEKIIIYCEMQEKSKEIGQMRAENESMLAEILGAMKK